MTAEANRRLLLPPSLTPIEHLEQAAASMSAPTLWVRGSGGERTRLPGKARQPKAGLQIQIALPIAASTKPVEPPQPPPPPQVLFRTHEVIRPPPVSEDRDEFEGPPGNAPLDPVDAPPGLADHPPGFDEEHTLGVVVSPVEAPEATVPSGLETEGRSDFAEPPLAQEELRASPIPILPPDYYEGAPGTLPSDPVDAPPGLVDEPPGFEEQHPLEEPAAVLPVSGDSPPGLEDVLVALPPIRPLGKPLNLPPVAHHQVGPSMEGPSKLAPPVRPLAPVEEPPEWRPYEDVTPASPSSPVQAGPSALGSEEIEDDLGEPPGLEMDALDELEEDMQLFGDLSEHSTSELEQDALGEPWSEGTAQEMPVDSALAEGAFVIEAAPRSVAVEAVESAWQARPLSERLAGGSLVVFGAWAIWKIWSVV